jgi:hypothetical protein
MKQGLVWWVVVLTVFVGGRAWGTPLTAAQLATLKQDILASDDMDTPVALGDAPAITTAYNLAHTPSFWVWRTVLTKYSVYSLTSPTGSTWNWTQFKGLTVPEQQAWFEMFRGESGTTNYTLPNIRAGVASLFTGSPTNTAQRDHVDAMGRRLATRAERLYVTGTGSTAAPGLLTWEGPLSEADVGKALALP